jgi:hypothetical protein
MKLSKEAKKGKRKRRFVFPWRHFSRISNRRFPLPPMRSNMGYATKCWNSIKKQQNQKLADITNKNAKVAPSGSSDAVAPLKKVVSGSKPLPPIRKALPRDSKQKNSEAKQLLKSKPVLPTPGNCRTYSPVEPGKSSYRGVTWRLSKLDFHGDQPTQRGQVLTFRTQIVRY